MKIQKKNKNRNEKICSKESLKKKMNEFYESKVM